MSRARAFVADSDDFISEGDGFISRITADGALLFRATAVREPPLPAVQDTRLWPVGTGTGDSATEVWTSPRAPTLLADGRVAIDLGGVVQTVGCERRGLTLSFIYAGGDPAAELPPVFTEVFVPQSFHTLGGGQWGMLDPLGGLRVRMELSYSIFADLPPGLPPPPPAPPMAARRAAPGGGSQIKLDADEDIGDPIKTRILKMIIRAHS